MQLEFDLKLRLTLPEPAAPSLQNLYFFNLYRAGSSVVEAVAEALALHSKRQGLNLTRDFYRLGVEYFDSQNYAASSVHLADSAQLARLTHLGGYLLYGFREIPLPFAQAFDHVGAAVLIVRDPRDIGISQYRAIAQHSTEGRILATQITSLREKTAQLSMETYLLSDETIDFLTRISQGYRPLIEKGVRVIRYEDMYRDGGFSLRLLCETLTTHLSAYLPEDWDFERFFANVEKRIANSKSLKGHATGGSIRTYEKLAPDLLQAYTARLSDSLALLGYTQE